MPVFLQCLSHSPLKGFVDPEPACVEAVNTELSTAREAIADFDPELVIIFAPDHFNGFFYDSMPAFAIGADAYAIGDFGTPQGRLSVDAKTAEALTRHLLEADIDMALSYRMQVDHGFAQPLGELLGGLDSHPIIPIFVNAVAEPVPTNRRALALGKAVGSFAQATGKRVLIIGSGGLSHEPPVPTLAAPDRLVVDRLKGSGRHLPPDEREARTQRVIAAGKQFAQDPTSLHPLAPEWDQAFMTMIADFNEAALSNMNNTDIANQGGRSAHEIKTWVAAAAAAAAFGKYRVSQRFYRPIHEWVAGYGLLSAQ